MFSSALLAFALAADPSPGEIAQAVRDLGAAKYAERERAMQRLWAAGVAAEPALRDALRSGDAEVVARARDLLDKIPFGITPDSPREFVELIATARAGGAGSFANVAPGLLDLGPRGMDVAEKLIQRIGTDDRERASLHRVVDREAWRVAPYLIARGDEGPVPALLERAARSGALDPDMRAVQHYCAWLAANNRAAVELPVWRERAAKDQGAAVIAYQLARFVGDTVTARAMAERTGRDELREAALFDAGAWADLALLPPPGVDRRPSLFGLRMLYQQLAGQPGAVAAFEELRKLQLNDSNSVSGPSVFRMLMFAGRVEDALVILNAAPPAEVDLLKFDLLCQRRRYEEAFALFDAATTVRGPARWARDAARLRIYHQLGDSDKCREIIDALPQEPGHFNEFVPIQEFVEQLVSLGRSDDARPFAAAVLQGGATPAIVLEKLFPKAPAAAAVWWRVVRVRHPSEAARESVDRLAALLDRRLAEPEGREMLAAAIAFANERSPIEAPTMLQALAEGCQVAGLTDDARTLMADSASRLGSVSGWIRLGDLLVEQRRVGEAVAAYDAACKKDERRALPLWLAGWARIQAGDANGREACERAHRLMLGNEMLRSVFVEELVKRNWFGPEVPAAIRRERTMILALADLASDRARLAQGGLSLDPPPGGDLLDAAGYTQRYLIRLMRSGAYFRKPEAYLVVLNRLQEYRARGLLARGEIEGALQAASAAQALLSGGTSPAEDMVLELVKRGKSAEAERVYRQPADVLDKLIAEYPRSAAFRNSRAWLAVRCRRDLPLAVEHARAAVAARPEAAGYHDTLAEALFQTGDTPGAKAAIQKAIELDPRSHSYRQRKVRIEAGDKDAAIDG